MLCRVRGKSRVPGGAVLEVDCTAFLSLQMRLTTRLDVVADDWIVT